MNKKKEKKVEFEADIDEFADNMKDFPEPEPEKDDYNFSCNEKGKFIVTVVKGPKTYKVVRDASEIKTARKILNKLYDHMMLKRFV
jgi:hypothetical protein